MNQYEIDVIIIMALFVGVYTIAIMNMFYLRKLEQKLKEADER